ncbi:MAG: nucleoside:proton symporter [Gammaproteobacteria bacterium]|nr:nucleoside:proton symporter [Gammaproteobacteria bacterium]MCP5202328.1 nucleoside:proton symporter [Gammaproteobacteria bacterium]
MIVLQALLGLLALHLASWWASEDRARIPWRTVAVALGLQVALAAALTRLPAATTLFDLVAAAMGAVQAATESAMRFLFGYLAGGPAPFSVVDADAGYVLALRALPVIIVMSAVARVLTHWGVLPWLVRRLSALLERSLGIGGALGLSAAANVFVGMTEAPLLVRPYLAAMSRGELFALMGCGMATIAGTVFVLFSNILAPVVPGAAGHLLTASLMSLPAAIGICVMLVPPATATGAAAVAERDDHGSFDALAAGAGQGLKLYFNILAMLLVLLASVHLVNLVLGQVTVGGTALSLQRLFGWMFAPVCWLMGVPWAEAPAAGALLGTKTILNELLAYLDLARAPHGMFGARTRLILTYALCGFANLGSLGMLTAALGVLAPARRAEITALGLRAIVAGTLATLSTGAVVGLVAP